MPRKRKANRYSPWSDYVSVAQRRAQAGRRAAQLAKQGTPCRPVVIEGRSIARTFWGKAWCENLESYSDYASRLPRGRTYVRNGSVIDLAVEEGVVRALVSGSEIYSVHITVKPQPASAWAALVAECTGAIGSLVELLQGRLSQSVMAVVTRPQGGLFPAPREIAFDCSCPDGAAMCKHVAAALYGVGARLDEQPELLFRLRHVDPAALIDRAGVPAAGSGSAADSEVDGLAGVDLSALFGIDIEPDAAAIPADAAAPASPKPRRRSRAGSGMP